MKKVLITGTFDIIHPGHLNFIKEAKTAGDFLVVTLARDRNVLKIKGRLPYFNEEQRLINFKKLGLADQVILGSLTDPYQIIKEQKPDVIALGYDQQVFVDQLTEKIKEFKLKTKIIKLLPFKEDFCKGKNLRKAIEDEQAGFLLINKEEDWTSHDVVAKLRGLIKIKQIGHTGTLDPFATGLLICAVGNATKMVGLFDLLPKTYQAKIQLGLVSDTYDRTGKIQNFVLSEVEGLVPSEVEGLVPSEVEGNPTATQIEIIEVKKVLENFVGRQEQLPPMYSAKKVDGKKLYELARIGIEITRKPSQIEIYHLRLLKFQDNFIDLEVKCSSGTYIRSLAHDLGKKLGTGAVLWELKRKSIGDFSVKQAIKLKEINQNHWQEFSCKPLEALNRINSALL